MNVISSVAPMNGLVIAGELFSITCTVTGADKLRAQFNFILTAENGGTMVHHEEDASDKTFTHSFTARASDAGVYACQVTVTSILLNNPITSSSTVTLTVQSKPIV